MEVFQSILNWVVAALALVGLISAVVALRRLATLQWSVRDHGHALERYADHLQRLRQAVQDLSTAQQVLSSDVNRLQQELQHLRQSIATRLQQAQGAKSQQPAPVFQRGYSEPPRATTSEERIREFVTRYNSRVASSRDDADSEWLSGFTWTYLAIDNAVERSKNPEIQPVFRRADHLDTYIGIHVGDANILVPRPGKRFDRVALDSSAVEMAFSCSVEAGSSTWRVRQLRWPALLREKDGTGYSISQPGEIELMKILS